MTAAGAGAAASAMFTDRAGVSEATAPAGVVDAAGQAPISARTQPIAVLYAENARRVHRQVARRVNAAAAVIEDACQTALGAAVQPPPTSPRQDRPPSGGR